jgi:hypothetical protein
MVVMESHMGSDTASTQRLELVRCGGYRSRFTSQAYEDGSRARVITNDRRSWAFNLATRKGRFLEDPGESYVSVYPVLTDSAAHDLRPRLEWAREFELFARARRTATQTREVGPYRFVFTGDSVPRRLIAVRGPDTVADMRYDSYREGLACDEALFQRPKGIDFSEAAGTDIQTILSEWTLPLGQKTFTAFTPRGILERVDLLGLPEVHKAATSPFVGFLAGALPRADSTLRADWASWAREQPGSAGTRHLELAATVSPDTLRRRLVSDAGQFDFFWGHYYATRDLADLAFIARALSTSAPPFPENLHSKHTDILRRAAEWSLRSHLKMLPFYRDDLSQVAASSTDKSVRKALRELME